MVLTHMCMARTRLPRQLKFLPLWLVIPLMNSVATLIVPVRPLIVLSYCASTIVPLIIVLMLDSVRELTENAGTLTCGTLMFALACLVAGITEVRVLKHYRTGTPTIMLVLERPVIGILPCRVVLLRSVLWTRRPYRKAGLLNLVESSYLPPMQLARLLVLRS